MESRFVNSAKGNIVILGLKSPESNLSLFIFKIMCLLSRVCQLRQGRCSSHYISSLYWSPKGRLAILSFELSGYRNDAIMRSFVAIVVVIAPLNKVSASM